MSLSHDQPLRLLLVEDNQALSAVLSEFLEDAGHEVLSCDSAEAVPSEAVFDIAILDLNLPGESGLRLGRRLKARRPSMGIVLLTIRSALDDKLQGYQMGADIFLSKPVEPSELLAVIHALSRRLPPESGDVSRLAPRSDLLTERELALLRCIAEGMSYGAAAEALGVSVSTVQSHIRSLYLKLGVNSKVAAVRKASAQGLL